MSEHERMVDEKDGLEERVEVAMERISEIQEFKETLRDRVSLSSLWPFQPLHILWVLQRQDICIVMGTRCSCSVIPPLFAVGRKILQIARL